MIGILGGLGPAATIDLMRQILALSPARSEPEQIPLVVVSDPRVPSLGKAILAGGASPVPALVERVRVLEAGGARIIAIACHAAHHWHAEIAAASSVPVLHIADAVCELVRERLAPGATIGVLAAESTLHSGFYQRKLAAAGYACRLLPQSTSERWVFPAIDLVKNGAPEKACASFEAAIDALTDAGADTTILACTEIPVALSAGSSRRLPACIDGTEALARACVRWWGRQHHVS